MWFTALLGIALLLLDQPVWHAAATVGFAGVGLLFYLLVGEQDEWHEDLPFTWEKAHLHAHLGMLMCTWPVLFGPLNALWWDVLARLQILLLLALIPRHATFRPVGWLVWGMVVGWTLLVPALLG